MGLWDYRTIELYRTALFNMLPKICIVTLLLERRRIVVYFRHSNVVFFLNNLESRVHEPP